MSSRALTIKDTTGIDTRVHVERVEVERDGGSTIELSVCSDAMVERVMSAVMEGLLKSTTLIVTDQTTNQT